MSNTFSDISNWLSGGNLGDATEALKTSANVVGNTQIPDLNTLIPQLKQQIASGLITPAQAVAAIQQSSAMENVSANPEAVKNQIEAINQLKEVATQGGMTAMDKAQLNDIQQRLANQNSAQQQAIQTAAAQQGLGTAGSTLASKMLASQGNATGEANAGATVAANAQKRALDAMQQYGTQAGAFNKQQFDQQAKVAEATDAINQFNAQNRQAANINYANNQQAANTNNITNQNAINKGNVEIANTQAMMPYKAAQENYTNTLNRNIATSNALNKTGTALMDQGNKQTTNTSGMITDAIRLAPTIIDAVPKVVDAVGNGASWLADTVGGWLSDETQKTDITPGDESVEAMMEKLTGKKFKYKSDSAGADGGKEHLGVMAQDAEKAGLPTMNTPQGKIMIDNDTTKGAVLAALGDLHKRVKQLEK